MFSVFTYHKLYKPTVTLILRGPVNLDLCEQNVASWRSTLDRVHVSTVNEGPRNQWAYQLHNVDGSGGTGPDFFQLEMGYTYNACRSHQHTWPRRRTIISGWPMQRCCSAFAPETPMIVKWVNKSSSSDRLVGLYDFTPQIRSFQIGDFELTWRSLQTK